MGKKAPKMPQAPDPAQTAAAQGSWNSFTAQQQQSMNMVGQNTPWGSLEYSQTGTTMMRDPSGRMVEVPQYTANVNLSPAQEAIFDQSQQAMGNLAGVAERQSANLMDRMSQPFEYSNQDAEKWAWDLASPRILAQQGQNENALRTQLVNSGIRPGTPAWDTEMARLTNANTDQMNQLALTGRQMAFNEALTTRNQPLNEMMALLSGTQVQSPTNSFAQTPQSQIGGVDYTSLVNQNYQNQMQQYQAKVQQQQGMMGGLFGLGGSLISAFSDERLKADIKRIGILDNGIPVYRYRMADGKYHVGVLAQEVQQVMPQAVVMDESGYLKVRYDLATEVH